jgi:hypothetical protein
MAQGKKSKPESPFDYILEKAIVSSSAFVGGKTIDIKNIVTDIEIYEHLDKAYLTGNVIFVDEYSLYNAVDFSGAEKLSLQFVLPGVDMIPVAKDFIIEKTVKNIRGNDRSATVLFHIVEEHAFNSSLINVNKSYTGKPTEIIQKIITDNLKKNFSGPIKPDNQSPIRVIIPNLTPLEAAKWVRDRATTIDGVPYFFFSTLANQNLHIIGLDEMLVTASDPKPYVYSQISTSFAAATGIDNQAYLIQNYTSKSNDEIISLVKKGLLGARYFFYDPLIGIPIDDTYTDFNLDNTLKDLVNKNIISKNQNKIAFTSGYELDGVPFASLNSKVITELVTTNTYDDTNIGNYSQGATLSDHKLKIVSEALRTILTRNAIEVALPGRNFLFGQYSNTIGNQISLRFLDTATTKATPSNEEFDRKKSGDYLMYAVKHQFKKERYDVIASCVKLADIPGDTEIS